ncbi:MAG: hypothetical protein NTV81_00665 [Candidatus Komeilibacteria bacterium]|nr:hypothetical protein [Candidatus Komeilibacteria bacterium]
MTDDLINLLPDDLRAQELEELARPSPAVGSFYNQPRVQNNNQSEVKPAPVKYFPSGGSLNNNQESAVEKTIPEPPKSPEIKDGVNSNNGGQAAPVVHAAAPVVSAKVPKTEPLVKFASVAPASKSWLATLFQFFIKPKNLALDQVITQTNGDLNFNVNLVPKSAYYLPSKILWLRLILGLAIIIFIISGIHLYFVILGRSTMQQVTSLQAALARNQQQLTDYQGLTQQLNQLEVQSKSINDLVGRHIYWTQFLTGLEALTLPVIYYPSMSASPKGDIGLQVVAPTYTDAAEQLIFWQGRPEIKKMEFSGLGMSASGGITFSVKLEIDPAIFYKQ